MTTQHLGLIIKFLLLRLNVKVRKYLKQDLKNLRVYTA